MDSSTLSIILTAIDNASAQIAAVGDQLETLGAKTGAANTQTASMGAALSNLGTTAGKLGGDLTKYVTLPIVGIAAAGADMSIKFQQSMTMIRTQAGDTQDSIATLSTQVLNLAKQSQFSPDELANGLYHITSLGLRGADAMNALNTAQQLAAVGGANLEDTATALGGALVTGINGVQNYTQAAGTLNAIVGAGNMRMQDLVSAIGTGVLPVFKNAGLSLTDFGAALATLTDNGQQADAAATHLRMTISLMESPSGTAIKALQAVGLASNQLGLDLQTKGLVPALDDLKQHLTDTYGTTAAGSVQMDAALTKMFGGGRSSAAIQTLLDEIPRVQSKIGQISQQGGQFAQDYAQQQATASAKIKTAWDTIQADAIQLGGAALPTLANALKSIVGAITNLFNWYTKLDPANKKLIDDMLMVAAVVGPVLLIFSKVVKVGEEVGAAFEALSTVVTVLSGSFSSLFAIITGESLVEDAVNPIFAIIAAILLLALAIYEIITHWQAVKDWIKKFWSDWHDEIIAFMAVFMPGILAIAVAAYLIIKYWDPIKDFFVDLWHDIYNTFSWANGAIQSTFDGVVNFFVTLWDSPRKAFDEFVGALETAFTTLGSDALQWGKDIIDAIGKGFVAGLSAVASWVGDLVTAIGNGILSLGSGLEDVGKSLVTTIHSGYDQAKSDAKQWGTDLVNDVKKGFDDAKRNAPQWGRDIVNGVKSGLEALASYDLNNLFQWAQNIDEGYQKALKWGESMLSGIGDAFTQGYHDAIQWGGDILSSIGSGFVNGYHTAVQWGKNVINSISSGFMTAVHTAAQWGTDVITQAGSGFMKAVRNVPQWGKDIISNIVDGLKSAWHAIADFFTNLPNILKPSANKSGQDTAQHHIDGMDSTFKDFSKMKKIGDDILKFIGMAILAVAAAIVLLAVALGISIINGIVKGIEDMAKALGDGVAWIGKHIVDAAAGFGKLLYDVGKDILKGLVSGMQDYVKDVEDAVTGIGKHITQIAKDVFKVFSPSKVFAEIGGNISLGLAQGIQDNSGTAVSATQKMTTSVVQAGANVPLGIVRNGASPAGGGFAGNVTINVNSQAMMGNSQEAQQFATTIYQNLQSIARRHGSAGDLPNIGILPI